MFVLISSVYSFILSTFSLLFCYNRWSSTVPVISSHSTSSVDSLQSPILANTDIVDWIQEGYDNFQLCGIRPPYFNGLCSKNMTGQASLQSANQGNQIVPCTRTTSIGNRCFPFPGAVIWKSWPNVPAQFGKWHGKLQELWGQRGLEAEPR